MRPLRFLTILAMITALLTIVSTPTSAVEPGDVLINEVAFKETNDWIEFYVQQAADYEGLRVYEGTTLVKEFPKITASAGDYIVLHFNGDPANDESDATGKGPNGYWDVDQSPTMFSVVVVNKGAGPGDVTSVYEGIPVR